MSHASFQQLETSAHGHLSTKPRSAELNSQLCTMLSTILPSRSKTTSPSASAPVAEGDATTTDDVHDPVAAALNESLEILHDVFPTGDVDNFRQLLSTTSEESRLYVVTEILLKSKKDSGRRPTRAGTQLEPWQKFRSTEYQQAVRTAL